jgi:hypothetical protein
MAHKSGVLDDFLHFASTPRSRAAVSFAAISFAVCHGIVLATAPVSADVARDLDAEVPRQIIHLAAVLCRFALPLAGMIVGMGFRRVKAPGKAPRSSGAR